MLTARWAAIVLVALAGVIAYARASQAGPRQRDVRAALGDALCAILAEQPSLEVEGLGKLEVREYKGVPGTASLGQRVPNLFRAPAMKEWLRAGGALPTFRSSAWTQHAANALGAPEDAVAKALDVWLRETIEAAHASGTVQLFGNLAYVNVREVGRDSARRRMLAFSASETLIERASGRAAPPQLSSAQVDGLLATYEASAVRGPETLAPLLARLHEKVNGDKNVAGIEKVIRARLPPLLVELLRHQDPRAGAGVRPQTMFPFFDDPLSFGEALAAHQQEMQELGVEPGIPFAPVGDGTSWVFCRHGDPDDPFVFLEEQGGPDSREQHRHTIRLHTWIVAVLLASELTRPPFAGHVLAPADYLRVRTRFEELAPGAGSLRIYVDM